MSGCLRRGGCYHRAIVGTVGAFHAIKADPSCTSCGAPTPMCCADCVLRSAGQEVVPVCPSAPCVAAHIAEHRCDTVPPAPAALMAMAHAGGP